MSTYVIKDGNGVIKYVNTLGDGTQSDPYIMTHMSHENSQIHKGVWFRHSDIHDISNGNDFNYIIKTPASGKHVTITDLEISSSSSYILVEIYEDTILSANGSSADLLNINRKSTNTASTLLYENGTVTSNGTLIASAVVTGGKNVGGATSVLNVGILKDNTIYLIYVGNESGATAHISFNIIIEEEPE